MTEDTASAAPGGAQESNGLRRSIGPLSLFSTAYGNVGSSIYYALGLVAAHALGMTPLVFLFAGGLFAVTAKTYAEGGAMFPEAGGSSSFARHAFNELVSFFAGWALMLDYLITIAISALFVPHYLAVFFPALDGGNEDVIAAAIVIVGLAALNIRGLGSSAGLNVVLAIADLCTQVAVIGLGAILVLDPSALVEQVDLGVAPSYKELIFALSISMVAYTGIETIANMAQEERDPGRDLPRTANRVVISVLILYLGISLVALSALPVTEVGGQYTTELGTTYKDDPILGIVAAFDLGWLQHPLELWVGALAATILLIATNAGMIGVSRLSWSLAEHRQLPSAFSRLYGPGKTPALTIAIFAVLAIVLVLPGESSFLGNLYSFGALLAFVIAHISIIALRLRQPDLERPYRAPWNISIRGKPVPMTAVIGAIGTFAAWVSVVALHEAARIIGPLWLLIGMAGYLLYRRHLGLGLRERQRAGLGRPQHLIERHRGRERYR